MTKNENIGETATSNSGKIKQALLLQLEDLATDTRNVSYASLAKELKTKKLDFSTVHFSRFCLAATPQAAVEKLGEGLGLNGVTGIRNALVQRLNNYYTKEAELHKNISAMIDGALAKGLEVGIITLLAEDAAQALMTKLGLDREGVTLIPFEDISPNFPRVDVWIRVSREMEVAPRHCAVLAGTQSGCKSALSACMTAVAVPDQFTDFQDFSGATEMLSIDTDWNATELLEELFSGI